MKNLNYENEMKSEYEEGETAQRVEEFVQRTEEILLNALRKNPKISRKELSKMLMISEDGVKYHLKKLKNKGLIEHIGTSRGGYWKVK